MKYQEVLAEFMKMKAKADRDIKLLADHGDDRVKVAEAVINGRRVELWIERRLTKDNSADRNYWRIWRLDGKRLGLNNALSTVSRPQKAQQ